jgi:hypothetical protein
MTPEDDTEFFIRHPKLSDRDELELGQLISVGVRVVLA